MEQLFRKNQKWLLLYWIILSSNLLAILFATLCKSTSFPETSCNGLIYRFPCYFANRKSYSFKYWDSIFSYPLLFFLIKIFMASTTILLFFFLFRKKNFDVFHEPLFAFSFFSSEKLYVDCSYSLEISSSKFSTSEFFFLLC